MSEFSNHIPAIPERKQLSSPETSSVPHRPPHILKRLVFIVAFVLFVGLTVVFTPDMAKHIAYSWNIGVERAKAEVAKQFLAENPLSGQRIALVAKAVSPSVVGILTITRSEEVGMNGERDGLGTGIGSGVIVDDQGYVLTNNHVIADAHLILVRLSDGREVEAQVVGRDRTVDLAVLQIDMRDLEAVPWGDSRQVDVGEQVVAIGSPYNLQQTVTSGIISATERYDPIRSIQGRRRGRTIPTEYLQTDAAINPGNSGGALVDMNGKLIGICVAIISGETGGNSGIGFAIPSFMAKLIYDEIVSQGKVQHGWIGVIFDYVTSQESQRIGQKKPRGAVVRNFAPGSPALNAGLQRRDVVLQWGETEITDPLHLTHLVLLSKPGTKETVAVFRGEELLTFEITVGVRPTDL